MEATVLGATTGAGLRLIESDPEADPAVVVAIREQARARVNRSWERLGTLGPGDDETPSEAQARLRTTMIREERAELLRIRDAGAVDHAVLSTVLGQLDAEETALVWSATRSGAVRASPLLPPDRIAGACEHLADAEAPRPPTSAEGCPSCLTEGLRWVHLRACATCGAGGLLQLLGGPPLREALPRHRPPGHAQHRARRGLALVLRRRGRRLRPATRRARHVVGHRRWGTVVGVGSRA